jgi:hypothetical protein
MEKAIPTAEQFLKRVEVASRRVTAIESFAHSLLRAASISTGIFQK